MPAPAATILLIDEGDLPSLAALATQADPGRVVLWHRARTGPSGPRRRAAVAGHASSFDVAELVVAAAPAEVAGDLEPVLGLLRAIAAAGSRGIGRVLWPVQVGPEPTRVGSAVDAARIASELTGCASSLAGGEPGSVAEPIIDLPLVDLTDEQVLDLADDGGAPLRGFWPCERGGREPCGGASPCAGCTRWKAAFAGLGLPWPWTTERV